MKYEQYTINAVFVKGTGIVEKTTYQDGSPALVFHSGYDRDALSVNLIAYGLIAPEGHVYVKGYGEHEGLPQALVDAGIAEFAVVPHNRVEFGGHDAWAMLMKVLVD